MFLLTRQLMIGHVLLDVRQVNVVWKMQTRKQKQKKWNMTYREKTKRREKCSKTNCKKTLTKRRRRRKTET
jgi:hypothetical protein